MKTPQETTGWLADTTTWCWRCTPAEPIARVLLAGPFGEERKCALRLMTNLGRTLAAAGFECLRVDYSGTGESGGTHADATISKWQDELQHAVNTLTNQGDLPLLGVGVRLGGNLILELDGLQAISCWEPLPVGQGFVEELQRRRAIKAGSGGGGQSGNDFDGYLVSDKMLKELSVLNLTTQLAGQLDRTVQLLHVTGAREPMGPWSDVAATVQSPHSFQLVRERPFWGRVDDKPREELFRATLHFMLHAVDRHPVGTDD